jgi:hypothetical protein
MSRQFLFADEAGDFAFTSGPNATADLLADTLSLLLEGARVSRQSVGVEGPCARFITVGEAVIAAFAHGTKGRKHSRSPRYAARKAKVP